MFYFDSYGRHTLTRKGVLFTITVPKTIQVNDLFHTQLDIDGKSYRLIELVSMTPHATILLEGEQVGLHVEPYHPISKY